MDRRLSSLFLKFHVAAELFPAEVDDRITITQVHGNE